VIREFIAETDATLRITDMSSNRADVEDVEVAWRAALVRVERLRQEYSHRLRSADSLDSNLEGLWFQLWSAERHRDELYRAID
jgi:hypothetical protein